MSMDERYHVGGYYINYDELVEAIKRDLRTHRLIMRIVKNHIDNILMNEFNINPEEMKKKDPSTYWAIIMELARSEMINLKDYIRSKFWRKKRENTHW